MKRRVLTFVRQATGVLSKVLNDNRVAGQFGNVWVAPQFVVWELLLDKFDQTTVNKVRHLDPMFESALGVKGVVVRQPVSGPLQIEVPSPVRSTVAAHNLPRGHDQTIPLGVTANSQIVSVDFTATPHLLIVGATGYGGKSAAMGNIIYQIIRSTPPFEARTILIDLKGTNHGESLARFETALHTTFRTATTVEEARWVLRYVWDFMERRKKGEISLFPHLYVFIDETFRLAKEWGQMDKFLGELASQARTFNIHLVIATQIATKQTLATTMVTQNIISRLVGPVHSANASAWALGQDSQEAHELLGNGDMIARLGGRVVRFQSGYVTPESLRLAEYPEVRKFVDLPVYALEGADAPVENGQKDVSAFLDWFLENAQEGKLTASQYLARKPVAEGGLGLSATVSQRAQAYAMKVAQQREMGDESE